MGEIHVSDGSFLYNADLNRFAGEVTRFCLVMENHTQYDVHSFLAEMNTQLPVLYANAQTLPDIGFDDDDMREQREIVEESNSMKNLVYESNLHDDLVEKLGSLNRYRIIFDPLKDAEPVESGFAEDLSSVYGDLRSALDIHGLGTEAGAQQAAWDWKFGLHHWGKHALSAMSAAFGLLTWHYDEDTGGFDR